MSQGGCQQPGSGFEEHRRPSRPAPPLPTPRLPERCPGGEGTSSPQAGREPPEAGTRAADTPPTPARARARAHPASPLAPRGFPRHPASPSRPPPGRRGPSPPPPHPRLRAVLRPNYRCPPAGRVGRPCPGKAACGRCPSPGAEGLLPRRTHIIHAKLIPAASRPPA